MKLIKKILSFFLVIFLLTATHIFIINFLPFPFNRVNIVFSLLLLFLIISSDTKIIWLGIATFYLIDLFNGALFGTGIIVAIASMLIINWFQFNILTNKTSFSVFLSLFLGLFLHRVLFIMFLTVNNYFFYQKTPPYKEMAADIGWEISLSSAFVFLIYLAYSKLLKRLNPTRAKYAKQIQII